MGKLEELEAVVKAADAAFQDADAARTAYYADYRGCTWPEVLTGNARDAAYADCKAALDAARDAYEAELEKENSDD